MLSNDLKWDGSSWVRMMTYSVVDRATNHETCVITLAKIYDSERNMNEGRFALYDEVAHEYVVSVRMSPSFDTCIHQNGMYFNWIAEQTDQKWSFGVDYRSIGEIYMKFSFEDIVTATMFKLVWYGYKW